MAVSADETHTETCSMVIRKELAAYAHKAWAGWMEYLFSNTDRDIDGGKRIPEVLVDRWCRQMKTPFRNLSIDEQKSDLDEADKILKIVTMTGLEGFMKLHRETYKALERAIVDREAFKKQARMLRGQLSKARSELGTVMVTTEDTENLEQCGLCGKMTDPKNLVTCIDCGRRVHRHETIADDHDQCVCDACLKL